MDFCVAASFLIFVGSATIGIVLLIDFWKEKSKSYEQTLAHWYTQQLAQQLAAERIEIAQREDAVRQRKKELSYERQSVLDDAQQDAEQIRSIARATAVQICAPIADGDNLESIDKGLRKLLMAGMVGDSHFTVKFLASPTGRFAIDWVVHDPSQSHYVEILRNGDLFRSDGSPTNHAADQLPRGRRHLFTATLYWNGRVQSLLKFEIKIPSEREWLRSAKRMVEKDGGLQGRFQGRLKRLTVLREMQLKGYEIVDLMQLPEDEQGEWKADVDAMIARERGEEEKGTG